jgi:opacity protein-like surface antigen
MKKIVLFTALLLLLSGAAFSAEIKMDLSAKGNTGLTVYAGPDDTAATGTNATPIGKTSTGVGVGILSDVTGYAAVTQHMNGTKAYGSSFDSTAMYQTIADVPVGTPYVDVPGASDSSEFSSGWRAM